jgi:hypothetical protein
VTGVARDNGYTEAVFRVSWGHGFSRSEAISGHPRLSTRNSSSALQCAVATEWATEVEPAAIGGQVNRPRPPAK